MERHTTDAVSLTAGAVFTALGVVLLLNRLDVLSQGRWIVPILLIAVALAILVSVAWPATRGTPAVAGAAPAPPQDPVPADEDDPAG